MYCRTLIFLVSLSSLWIPVEGRAQAADPITTMASRGKELVKAKRYKDAVRVYLEANRLKPHAGLLYNIAYIYDKKLNQPKRAINYYQQYIDAPDANTKLKLRAYERLRTLEEDIRLATPRALPPLPRPKASAREIGGWASTVTGTVLAATGITFMSLAASSHTEFEETDDLVARRQLREEGELRAMTGDITLGIGLLAVGTGLALLLWDEAEHDARAGPRLVLSTKGLGIEGAF